MDLATSYVFFKILTPIQCCDPVFWVLNVFGLVMGEQANL
jgi:hypothetical protein